MQALKKDEPGLLAQLKMAKFAGIQGDVVRTVFAKEAEIFFNMLKSGDRAEKIEAALSKEAGRPLRLSFELDAPPQVNENRQQNVLQGVFDAFGRENVEVVDD